MKTGLSKYFLNLILPLLFFIIGAGSAITASYLMDAIGLLKLNLFSIILFLAAGFIIFELILFGFKMFFGNIFVFIKSEKVYTEKTIKTAAIIDKTLEKNTSKTEKKRLSRVINIKED